MKPSINQTNRHEGLRGRSARTHVRTIFLTLYNHAKDITSSIFYVHSRQSARYRWYSILDTNSLGQNYNPHECDINTQMELYELKNRELAVYPMRKQRKENRGGIEKGYNICG